jgi:ABC-type proline/glycine betaine transport system permease subunit
MANSFISIPDRQSIHLTIMNIQLIIVILIGLVVGIILLRNIYKFFSTKRDSPYCGGCKGCEPIKRSN